jgi:hypothetical protein
MTHLPNIDALIKHSFSFYWGSEVDEAPEEGGVYAWFLPNIGGPSVSLGKLFATVQKNVDQFSKLTEVVGRVGTTRLAIRQSTGSEDWEGRIPDSDWPLARTQVECIGNLLLALSIFSPPIYVGMASGEGGLRQRLRQHIDGQYAVYEGDPYLGSFAARVTHLMNDRRTLKRCIVACLKISGFPKNSNLIREIEHFLIQSIKPTQSKKG